MLENINILCPLFNEYKKIEFSPFINIINENDASKRSRTVVMDIGTNKLFAKHILEDLNIKNDDNFCQIIIARLNEIKNNSISIFEKLISKFKKCYDEYIQKLSNYINQMENNLSKIINPENNNNILLNYVINNIFNKINNLNEIYDNIINNIEENFELLNIFFEQTELFNQKKPLEYFLIKNNKNILNCSIVNKFNFEGIDIFNISKIKYYKYYLDFLKNNEKMNYIKFYSIKKDEKAQGIKFISQNFHYIKKLELEGMNSKDLREIMFNIYGGQIFNKNKNNILKIINIKDFDFSNYEKLDLLNLKEIEKLKFKNGKYINHLFLSDIFLKNTKNLISLTLEKVNMNDVGVDKLMHILPNYFDTLEYLNLANNSISVVKRDIFNLPGNSKKTFKKLKIFDLYKNNIYNFEITLEKFPKLKLLDLSSNSILTKSIMDNMIKEKDKVVLFNDNLFITNNSNDNDIYIEYLNKRLSNIDYSLKTLHLCFTYDEEKQEKLKLLKISPSIKVSLIKLDLSFCGLKTDIVINFLKNNFGMLSLKKLNLKYNNIESDIFQKILCDEIILENLFSFNLSQNLISCKEYEENNFLVNFIEKHQHLAKIKLIETNYFTNWNLNTSIDFDSEGKYRNLYLKFMDNLKKNNRNFKFIIDKKHSDTIEEIFKGLFSFK